MVIFQFATLNYQRVTVRTGSTRTQVVAAHLLMAPHDLQHCRFLVPEPGVSILMIFTKMIDQLKKKTYQYKFKMLELVHVSSISIFFN